MKIRTPLKTQTSFLLPAIILILLFVVYPVVATFLLSFNINPVPGIDITNGKHVGFSNYQKLFNDFQFINIQGIKSFSFPVGALIDNIIWIVIHLPLTIFLGLFLAILLYNVKGGTILRGFIFLGMVIPMIVGGLLIEFSFDRTLGIVNLFLRIIGLGWLARSWTIYPNTALLSLIIGSTWLWTGFAVTMYSAGLASLPKEVIEASIVDGASFKMIVFDVIWPMLKPVTVTVVAMTLLWDLKIFDIVYASTQGGPGGASMVLALLMYNYFAILQNYPMSATVSVIITVIVLPIVLVWIKASMKEVGSSG